MGEGVRWLMLVVSWGKRRGGQGLKVAVVLFAVFALASSAIGKQQAVILKNDKWTVTVQPDTMSVMVQPTGRVVLRLASPQSGLGAVHGLTHKGSHLQWQLPTESISISMDLVGNDLRINIRSTKDGKFTWPVIPYTKPAKALIWPRWEGCFIPLDDAKWTDYLVSYGEWNTLEGITMPFWGLDCGDYSLTCIVTNPCNNGIVFSKPNGRLQSGFTHEFTSNNPVKEYGFVIRLASNPSPVEPARQFRKWLVENGKFVSMQQKLKSVPKAERLLGAPHVYLWGDGLLTRHDIRANQWQPWCRDLVEQSKADGPSVGKRLKELMASAQWAQVEEISGLQYPYAFIKDAVTFELSRLFALAGFYDKASWTGVALPDEATRLLARAKLSTPELCRMNCLLLQSAYPDALLPVDEWGDGVSVKMLKRFKDAGFDRMMLCVGGVSSVEKRPEVAEEADKMGYLFGTYDSYHSIHNPALNGTEATWETAQFDQKLYDTGAIVRKDGTKLSGFKRAGYKLSPIAAWPYVKKRVSENMASVPLNYYFIDCDAFGEAYDDYSPLHPATQAQDIAARVKRLSWISAAFHAVVGSEGGSAYAAPAIHVAEGMFGPSFGWGDTDLTDKKSPFYLGAYYPADGPRVFTQQVPIKPEYETFFYDPRYRLPLYEAVFHDSVVSTEHWSCGSLKFKDVLDTVALTELLYQVPPLYHMNLDEFKKHQATMKKHYAFFSPVHRELGFEPMTDFAWLTPDRLVQRTVFGDKAEMVANFGESQFNYKGAGIPARSIVVRWLKTGKSQMFTADAAK